MPARKGPVAPTGLYMAVAALSSWAPPELPGSQADRLARLEAELTSGGGPVDFSMALV